MNDQEQTNIESYGQQLGHVLNYLELPENFSRALIEIIPDLSIEQIVSLCESLESSVQEKAAIETTDEFMTASDAIDQNTLQEIDAIINE